MENLILSVNVVLPLFLLMSAGYLTKQLKLYDMNTHAVMNRLVFKLFLPVLLFYNIYETSLDAEIDGSVFIFAVVSVLVMFGLLFAVIPLVEKENRRRGVLIQGIGRSNFVLFGMPMAEMLCGGEMATTSLLVAVVVPMFNVLSVIALEVFRGGKVNLRKILLGIAKTRSLLALYWVFWRWLSDSASLNRLIRQFPTLPESPHRLRCSCLAALWNFQELAQTCAPLPSALWES